MAGSKTNYLEAALINHLLRNRPFCRSRGFSFFCVSFGLRSFFRFFLRLGLPFLLSLQGLLAALALQPLLAPLFHSQLDLFRALAIPLQVPLETDPRL